MRDDSEDERVLRIVSRKRAEMEELRDLLPKLTTSRALRKAENRILRLIRDEWSVDPR